MTTAQEYRKFADECLRWATEAETEEFKDAFIQMARDWTLAAMRLDGVSAPLQIGRSGAQHPPQSREAALVGGRPLLENAGI